MENNLQKPQEQEEKINSLLQLGLKTYFLLKKHKQDEWANLILARASKIAEIDLKLLNIKYHKVYCGCGRQLTKGIEIEWFNRTGECLSCDSQRSDI